MDASNQASEPDTTIAGASATNGSPSPDGPDPSQTAPTGSKKRTIKDFFSSRTSASNILSSPPTNDLGTGKQPAITASEGRDAVRIGNKRVKCDTSDAEGIPRRGNSRAKLARLPALPLDVLCEVFAHLRPVDLLHLTRTTKALRRLLLHRSSTYVWTATLQSVPGLPQCPEDVSPPFWTNLLFDTHCHNCATMNVSNVNFILHVRYCVKCAKIKLMPLPKSAYKNYDKFGILRKSVPVSGWYGYPGDSQWCLKADALAFNEALDSIKGDRSAFLAQKQQEVEIRCETAKEAKEWLNAGRAERQIELGLIHDSRENAIRDKLIAMGYTEELEFLDELEQVPYHYQRRDEIIMFSDHPHVKHAKELTERIWNNIEFAMVDYMLKARRMLEQHKIRHAKHQRRILIHTTYVNWRGKAVNLARYPPYLFMPGPSDIMEFPLIKGFVEGPTTTETETDISSAEALLEGALCASLNPWRTDAISRLWKIVRDSRICEGLPWHCPMDCPMNDMLANLSLAVVTFKCTRAELHRIYNAKRCRDDDAGYWDIQTSDREQRLWYPEFLFHPCNAMCEITYDERTSGEYQNLSLVNQYLGDQMRQTTWSSDGLLFDEKAARTTRNILTACGLDYRTTTTKSLDDLDPRLVCLKCTRGERCNGVREVHVWTWRDAVQHSLKAHFGDASLAWECLAPPDTMEARIHGVKGRALSKQKVWKCMRCRDTNQDEGRLSWAALQDHFRQNPKHGCVSDMYDKENVLYYRALDFSPRERPPLQMTPSKTS